MKAMKKMLSVLMAVAMVMVMAVPAMAAEGTGYTITIQNATAGHTYEAYQIFTGDLSGDTLSNIQWGTGVSADGQTYFGDATDKAESVKTAELAQAFAKEVAAYLQNPTESGAHDDTAGTYTISNLAPGYYLVKDKDRSLTGDDAYTAYIMEVVKDVNVTPKSDRPSLDKQIKHNESDAWGVVGDNQIGDTVEFRTITTVPNVSNYTKYDYIIHDTMSDGLTSNVKSVDDVTIKVSDTIELDSGYYTVDATGNTFAVTVNILQAIADGKMKAGDELYTYYTGVLNESAKVYDEGSQSNTAYLEYSNNPNNSEDKGKTPEKTVYDWTFKMGINKIDGATQQDITGAKFVLAKAPDLTIAVDENGAPTSSADTTNLIKLVKVDNATYRVATSADAAAKTTYVIDAGNVTIKGLDDATDYYLYETKAPAGYNSLTEPVKFNISATYVADGSAYESVNVKVGESEPSSDLSTNIANNAGSTLPSTGGRGTRLFYIIGGVIVVAAAVLLVAKKRMKNNG